MHECVCVCMRFTIDSIHCASAISFAILFFVCVHGLAGCTHMWKVKSNQCTIYCTNTVFN